MQPLVKRWQVAPRLDPEADSALWAYPPILRQILYNRGVATEQSARFYIEARPPAETDPFVMLGVPAAVDRLEWAILHNEKIAIYGDYDADGVTATALLVEVLKGLNAQVQGYIPNRFDEGYGLNKEALDALHGSGVNVVVTVDCGIRSLVEADHAQRIGIDLIITD
ncbi:MAG: single-stranded-DNA-specific exonuclease RecJ, partial [Chloroflexota bacterium]